MKKRVNTNNEKAMKKNKIIAIISSVVIISAIIMILSILVSSLGENKETTGKATKNEITSTMAVIAEKTIKEQKNLKKVTVDLNTLKSTKIDDKTNHWLLGGDVSEPNSNQKHGFALDVYFDRNISNREGLNSKFKYRTGTATID
ncbi:hypothetical protein [Lactococcus cremoris]|uniref:hypothetical protein n=1 Tax=Lactococcus lactis subsp. cremoris TaxID=1359 RepID=UPI0021822030|nr:hypothetical protein [Lactococcus cremoris]MCT0476964.1 hypothetical protein [Lactococcus cremoris]